MKMKMTTHFRRTHTLACLAAGLAFCLSAPLPAQEFELAAPAPQAPAKTTFDLSFKSGDLQSLVKQVQEVSPEVINVVIPPGSEDIYVPRLELRQVKFEELAETLSVLLTDRPGKQTCQFIKTGRNLWTFTGTAPKTEFAPGEVPLGAPRLCTFALNDLLQVYEMSDIVTLLTTIWEVSGEKPPKQMSVHEETMMLIMMADEKQEGDVQELINKLAAASEAERKKRQVFTGLERKLNEQHDRLTKEMDHERKLFDEEIARLKEREKIQELRYREKLEIEREKVDTLKQQLREYMVTPKKPE